MENNKMHVDNNSLVCKPENIKCIFDNIIMYIKVILEKSTGVMS